MEYVLSKGDYDSEEVAQSLAEFLIYLGGELQKEHLIRTDISFAAKALPVYNVIVHLKPDDIVARRYLIVMCRHLGNTQQAQSEASLLVQNIDKALASGTAQGMLCQLDLNRQI